MFNFFKKKAGNNEEHEEASTPNKKLEGGSENVNISNKSIEKTRRITNSRIDSTLYKEIKKYNKKEDFDDINIEGEIIDSNTNINYNQSNLEELREHINSNDNSDKKEIDDDNLIDLSPLVDNGNDIDVEEEIDGKKNTDYTIMTDWFDESEKIIKYKQIKDTDFYLKDNRIYKEVFLGEQTGYNSPYTYIDSNFLQNPLIKLKVEMDIIRHSVNNKEVDNYFKKVQIPLNVKELKLARILLIPFKECVKAYKENISDIIKKKNNSGDNFDKNQLKLNDKKYLSHLKKIKKYLKIFCKLGLIHKDLEKELKLKEFLENDKGITTKYLDQILKHVTFNIERHTELHKSIDTENYFFTNKNCINIAVLYKRLVKKLRKKKLDYNIRDIIFLARNYDHLDQFLSPGNGEPTSLPYKDFPIIKDLDKVKKDIKKIVESGDFKEFKILYKYLLKSEKKIYEEGIKPYIETAKTTSPVSQTEIPKTDGSIIDNNNQPSKKPPVLKSIDINNLTKEKRTIIKEKIKREKAKGKKLIDLKKSFKNDRFYDNLSKIK